MLFLTIFSTSFTIKFSIYFCNVLKFSVIFISSKEKVFQNVVLLGRNGSKSSNYAYTLLLTAVFNLLAMYPRVCSCLFFMSFFLFENASSFRCMSFSGAKNL